MTPTLASLTGALLLGAGGVAAAATGPKWQVTEFPVGLAYAATTVNATVFRVQAVASEGGFQYTAYYDGSGHVVVARRALQGKEWEIHALDFTADVKDAHNDVVLGLTANGTVHLAYDHHNQALHYRRSEGGDKWWAFGGLEPMTGKLETRESYPTFLPGPNGALWYFYRDGQSGNGRLCINRYDTATKTWQTVQAPLIEGEGARSPYWWRPEIGPDGVIHLAWCWRDTPNAASNHDISYVRSRDNGATWETAAGKTVSVPVKMSDEVVAEKIATGQNLINQCTLAIDAQGHPHIAYYRNGADEVPQYFHLWNDGQKWSTQQVSHRTQGFTLGGAGTLKLPISRPEIAVSKSGTVYLIAKDDEFGGGVRLYAAHAPYEKWEPLDVIKGPLGEWEPSYDLARWRKDGVLALFVLPVRQGDHETTTDLPPQMARVAEITGLE